MRLHETGADFRLCFDEEARLLRVYTHQTLIFGFKGSWEEKCNFSSSEQWYQSEYSQRVSKADVRETIDWFWIDLETDSAEVATTLLT